MLPHVRKYFKRTEYGCKKRYKQKKKRLNVSSTLYYVAIKIILNMLGCVPRAVNEARTRDPQLGKLVLYQLSYYRIWADTRTRTGDLFITNELLYQLSHIGLSLLISNGALSQMWCKGSCFFDKHQMFCRFYSAEMEKYHPKPHRATTIYIR